MIVAAEKGGSSFDEFFAERASAHPAGRFGDACAYLCSAQAGYITGQNFLIDGGGYPGTM